jgi:hypothetical protein
MTAQGIHRARTKAPASHDGRLYDDASAAPLIELPLTLAAAAD